MNRNKLLIVFVILVALNVVWIFLRMSDARCSAQEAEARALETQHLSRNLRNVYSGEGEDYFAYIAGLTKYESWRREMPLSSAQGEVIPKLDKLVRDAAKYLGVLSANYMDTNPVDYADYMTRFTKRLSESVRHAERMVTSGLLTEPQAAYFHQRVISRSSQPFFYNLSRENIQELLGLTESQKKELAHVQAEAVIRSTHLGELNDREKIRNQMMTNDKEAESAAKKILTPKQLEMWDHLAAERKPLTAPPDLAALSDTHDVHIQLADRSPVFRELNDKAESLKLSSQQKGFLNTLEEITRQGLYWISRRNGKIQTDAVTRAQREFLKDAEQVALFGILTEEQAKQFESLQAKSGSF